MTTSVQPRPSLMCDIACCRSLPLDEAVAGVTVVIDTVLVDIVSKSENVTVQVFDGVVSHSVRPVAWRSYHFYPASAMELAELVGIAHEKIQSAAFRNGRAFLQEDLHFSEIHARHSRRIPPREAEAKAQFVGVEIDGSVNVANLQSRMVSFAIDLRFGLSAHCCLLALTDELL